MSPRRDCRFVALRAQTRHSASAAPQARWRHFAPTSNRGTAHNARAQTVPGGWSRRHEVGARWPGAGADRARSPGGVEGARSLVREGRRPGAFACPRRARHLRRRAALSRMRPRLAGAPPSARWVAAAEFAPGGCGRSRATVRLRGEYEVAAVRPLHRRAVRSGAGRVVSSRRAGSAPGGWCGDQLQDEPERPVGDVRVIEADQRRNRRRPEPLGVHVRAGGVAVGAGTAVVLPGRAAGEPRPLPGGRPDVRGSDRERGLVVARAPEIRRSMSSRRDCRLCCPERNKLDTRRRTGLVDEHRRPHTAALPSQSRPRRPRPRRAQPSSGGRSRRHEVAAISPVRRDLRTVRGPSTAGIGARETGCRCARGPDTCRWPVTPRGRGRETRMSPRAKRREDDRRLPFWRERQGYLGECRAWVSAPGRRAASAARRLTAADVLHRVGAGGQVAAASAAGRRHEVAAIRPLRHLRTVDRAASPAAQLAPRRISTAGIVRAISFTSSQSDQLVTYR